MSPTPRFAALTRAFPLRGWNLLLVTLLSAVVTIDCAWLAMVKWSPPEPLLMLRFVGVPIALLLPLCFRRYRAVHRLRLLLLAAVCFMLTSLSTALLSYLVVGTNEPLVDDVLARWDAQLGFDWIAWHDWLQLHSMVQRVLFWAYASGGVQIFVVIAVLALTGRAAQLAEYLGLFMIAATVSVACSGLVPAAGAFKYYRVGTAEQLATTSHFEPLRDGSLRHFPLGDIQGLISMPSLHAALAILFAYALRGTGVWFVAALVLDAAMLVSTPTEGGHYLVDVLAGAGLAVGLIWLCSNRKPRTAVDRSASLPALRAVP